MSEVIKPLHGYVYLSGDDDGTRCLEDVAEVELHSSRAEVCVTFEDGEWDIYRTDFVEVE